MIVILGFLFFSFCSNIRIACPTWDFERHAKINLHDWDVFHSWSFLVHLHIKEFISKRVLPYMSVTTFTKYPVQWKWLPTQSNYWRRWAIPSEKMERPWCRMGCWLAPAFWLLSSCSGNKKYNMNSRTAYVTYSMSWDPRGKPDLLTVSLRRLILILSQWQL